MLDLADPEKPLDPEESLPAVPPQARKLLRHLREFGGYIADNARMIPNDAERRRDSEVVSTAFVESTVNQVVAKRCCPGSSRGRGPRGMSICSSSCAPAPSTGRSAATSDGGGRSGNWA